MALRSRSFATIIDLLAEGIIEGWANNNDVAQSTYFQETQVKNADGTYNFDGVTIQGLLGTDTQVLPADAVSGDVIQSETIVNVKITNAGGAISRSLIDDEIDHLRVTFSLPSGLIAAYDSGKQSGLDVKFKATITPFGGVEKDLVDIEGNSSITVSGKSTSEYRKQVRYMNIKDQIGGVFPYVLKVYRTTGDRTSSAKETYRDESYWYSYSELKEVKIQYRDRAAVSTYLKAEDFGDNIPARTFKIKGLKIKIPSNYTPRNYDNNGARESYLPTWDGTWRIEEPARYDLPMCGGGPNHDRFFCDNPAWVLYDLLTNKRYGLGLDEDKVDKWSLYSIAAYCDGNVNYQVSTRQTDGTYQTVTVTQPRYTFNGIISNKEQALTVINHFSGVFRGFPLWSTGLVTFNQDTPGSINRIASTANVIDGIFEYEGTSRRQRTTAVKIGWNDPDNYGKRDTIILEDRDGIVQYGYQPFDFFAIGCNNRNEAILRGKYALYTNINQTEFVKFRGGLEWADSLPGDIIGVQDPDYAGETWSGRISNSTVTSVTLDKPVTLVNGITYTLYVQQNNTNVATKTITNSPGTTSILTWTGALSEAPQSGNVWVISSTSLAIRKFRIISIKESESTVFDISAYEYDPNKYSQVENNVNVEEPIPTTRPGGALDSPSNIEIQAYSYTDGDLTNRKYGMLINWQASPDPRTEYYQLRYTKDGGGLIELGTSTDTSYDFKDVIDGTYDIYLRSCSLTANSPWISYADFVMTAGTTSVSPPINLQVKGGGAIWGGRDVTMEWDLQDEATFNSGTVTGGVVKQFKVEVYNTSNLQLKRTYFTSSKDEQEFTYTYAMNSEDFAGSPSRALTFKVYSVDYYANLSTAATLAVSNPAPSMASTTPVVTAKTGYLKVTWTPVADIDMYYYKIYYGTTNPPTTVGGNILHPNTIFEIFDVSYGTNYYVQVEPYDAFGVGIKSVIPSPVSPLQIPTIDVDVELADSIVMSDSDSNGTSTLIKLYNRNFTTDGVTYTITGVDKHIEYAYNLENYFDRIGVWCSSASTRVYVGYSIDGVTWYYLSGEVDHTLDANSALVPNSRATSKTNYWQLAVGMNIGLFPNNISAKYVRLYLTGTYTTTIFEMVPSRLLISELAAIDSLSAISANIGTITAGNLQSPDYGPATGINIDLDAKTVSLGGNTNPVLKFYNDGSNKLDINAAVTFRSGSTGYTNITDAPNDLSEIDPTAASKLNGIQDGATYGADYNSNVTGKPNSLSQINPNEYNQLGQAYTKVTNWDSPSNETLIDGGKIYAGSAIGINEGGFLRVGKNVLVDSFGQKGSIVVATDGTILSNGYLNYSTSDYAKLTDGELNFYYYNGSGHTLYNSVKRIESGTANNGTVVYIPGIWKSQPIVRVFPNIMASYNPTYREQSQSVAFSVTQLTPYEKVGNAYKYYFVPSAYLQLTPGSLGNTGTVYSATRSGFSTWDSPVVYTTPNTTRLTASASSRAYAMGGYQYESGGSKGTPGTLYYGTYYYNYGWVFEMWYYDTGYGWLSASGSISVPSLRARDGFAENLASFDTGTRPYAISQFFFRMTPTGSESRYFADIPGAQYNGAYTEVNLKYYNSDLTGVSVLAQGSVNWLAIGQ
jgi:predicted phage tail protein